MNQKLFYWIICGDKMVGSWERGMATEIINGGEDEDEWRLGVGGRGARRVVIMSVRTITCRVQDYGPLPLT